ncbi:MAG: CocE/NonD family hydrolase [Clostridiales Family XIII bacterium]|nr:CocE/NonD family hydrolase [Clostridiales Family XIII bacterium]
MAKAGEIIRKKKKYGDEEIEVIYRKLKDRPEPGASARAALAEGRQPIHMLDGFGDFPELNPRTYKVCPGILCEQDVEIVMRDGVKTYGDIYRPEGQTDIPVIISWSWFGKRPCADSRDAEYQTFGVPFGSHSKHTKFEGPDPEYWCHKGYAVLNYDFRGVNNSEGDIEMTTEQEAIDGYDVVEFLARLPWCNGKIGMAGNSGLAIAQWKTASAKPPHLACIAPWEGNTDNFREMTCMGGIPECGFNPHLTSMLYGRGYMEDTFLMTQEYPLINAFWEDKYCKFENIDIPCYVTSGWCHFHNRGSFEGFNKIKSKQKWLRVHRDFEWPDQYHKESLADLTDFFDRYLKGIRNGWESTPTIRIDVMDAYDCDFLLKRAEETFPLERTIYKRLWLNAEDKSLNREQAEKASKCTYDAKTGRATFDMAFEEETEITGYMKLRLWVEADGSDDMDLFVAIQKLDKDGKWLPTYILGKPHPGAAGKLRVSMRELDPEKTTDYKPYYTFKSFRKLSPGERVPVDIEIWPTSRIWHAGEQIRVEVMGHYERIDWFEPFDYNTFNNGTHIIHTGGEYDSYLQIPVIPPKYKSAGKVYY